MSVEVPRDPLERIGRIPGQIYGKSFDLFSQGCVEHLAPGYPLAADDDQEDGCFAREINAIAEKFDRPVGRHHDRIEPRVTCGLM